MTIFLSILGVLLLIILGIMLLRVHVIIEADTSARVFLKILFIKIQLYPKSPKALKIKDYSPDRIAKRDAKAKKKADEKLKKKAKKEQKKKEAEAKNKQGSQDSKKKKLSLSDITELVSLVLELVKTFFSKFGQRLRLDLTKIHITIGAEDAAKTAIAYGAVSAGVSYLCEYLDSLFTIRPKGNKDIVVNADFLSEKTSLDITVSASLKVWHALDIALAVAIRFVKKKLLNK